MRRNLAHRTLSAALLLGSPAAPALLGAQSGLGNSLGMDITISAPLGEFRQHVPAGVGVGVSGAISPRRDFPLALRGDLGFVQYGAETSLMCFSHGRFCDAMVNVDTRSTVGFLYLGPQLAVAIGPVEPYVQGGVGFAYFGTMSQVRDAYSQELLNTSYNQGNYKLSWSYGGGVMIRATEVGASAMMIDLGVRYHRNGSAEYMRPKDVRQQADGSIEGAPTRSEANFLTIRLGMSLTNLW